MKINKIVKKPFGDVLVYPKFDFIKPVKKQRRLLVPLIWALTFPETIKRKLNIKKINMESLKDKPYVLLCNHNSFYDFKVATRAIFPRRATYVVAIDGFINREWIMREVGCFGKRKFENDLHVIRQIKRSVIDLNHICIIYPEARYSHVGTNSSLPLSLGKMVKYLKVPVVTLITNGNHLAQPVWNLRTRKVHTKAVMNQIITSDDAINLSSDEINEKINQAFYYDDYEWQKENNIIINEKFRAEGLENVLYKCPVCESEGKMESKDHLLKCSNCKSNWQMNEFGELINDFNTFTHIPDWYNWQREKVLEEILNDTYNFNHEVFINSLPSSKGFYEVGEGVITHTKEGFVVKGVDIKGEKFELIQSSINNYGLHVEYNYFGRGNGISFSQENNTYYMFSKKKTYLVTKAALATEEIYKLLIKDK